jgi:hypothetical protein
MMPWSGVTSQKKQYINSRKPQGCLMLWLHVSVCPRLIQKSAEEDVLMFGGIKKYQ